ncbi:carbohydrate-binding module family 21 protein [Auriscalpium vulgare]|uniref:Carbohydrate-binding module family 21 protein n=1 Tax=Auriscalpium vulgare TaxID=40419 RepID=A0ACB8SB97_9AGAM|nr:carbohydrate-binding module family 21 protein [Auriscalpium vulgare]
MASDRGRAGDADSADSHGTMVGGMAKKVKRNGWERWWSGKAQAGPPCDRRCPPSSTQRAGRAGGDDEESILGASGGREARQARRSGEEKVMTSSVRRYIIKLALPRRTPTTRRALFHIDNDDDHEPSPPPSPPLRTPADLPTSHSPLAVPFPTSPDDSPTAPPKITRTASGTNIVLANGRPLKSSLKSSSSSSLADDFFDQRTHHAHTRAQSMPSTPAYGPKNVHFKDKDEGLESVRLFRRTGKPLAVSRNPADDTETETETEPGFPFPLISGALGSGPPPITEIASASPVPAEHPPPYACIHVESISLPPARPPVLRGTVLVRNLAFEKHVGVRFTLDDWTTVSEVLATYAGPVQPRESLAGTSTARIPLTVGDLVGTAHAWDRFAFAVRLEDYEARLFTRTLFLVARFTAPGVGEWWDNNGGANYRVAFRAKAVAAPSPTAPRASTAPFMLSASAASPPRNSPHDAPLPTFAASRRAASSPGGLGVRLNLRHYAAPTRPTPVPVLPTRLSVSKDAPGVMGGRVVVGGQPATMAPEKEKEKEDDEGFGTGSDEEERAVAQANARRLPPLTVNISPPTPTSGNDTPTARALPSSPLQTAQVQTPRQASPQLAPRSAMFSPTSVSPALRPGDLPADASSVGDSTYAALLREWCFAQGEGTSGAVSFKPPKTPTAPVWGGGPMGSVGGA